MSKNKNLNQNFFEKWTTNMAYIVGFICADGNLTDNKRGSKFVSIYSVDFILLKQIKKILSSDHKISKRKDNCYRIQIGSKKMFDDLGKKSVHPNKTNRMILPNMPTKFLGDFIRGYFDGDGNVWSGLIHKDRPKALLTIRVVFTSCSEIFLQALSDKIERKIKIKGVLSSGKGNYFRLTYSMRGALKLYKIMYNTTYPIIFLNRKKQVFDKFMKITKKH